MANTEDVYHFHQTPEACAKDLIAMVPLQPGDSILEPFKGEGAFFNNFPASCTKDWAEITQGRDYKDVQDNFDWVITNPPFRLETGNKRVNSFWYLLDYFTTRTNKGIAFLGNDRCFCTLTPRRMKLLESRGWSLTKVAVCSIKKWRGRYFFFILEKNKTPMMTYLEGNY